LITVIDNNFGAENIEKSLQMLENCTSEDSKEYLSGEDSYK
jgi:hypothetical protein